MSESPKKPKAAPKDFFTRSGIPVQETYRPEDSAAFSSELGEPGQFPFTRGVQKGHVSRTYLDHASVRGVWHAGRIE